MKSFIILLFLPLSCFCQTDNEDTQNGKYKSFGVSFSPDYCYRILKYNGEDISLANIVNRRDSSEIPKFGYSIEVRITKKISDRIDLEAGVAFSNRGEKTKKEAITFSVDPLTGQTQKDPSLPTALSLNYSYNYIEFPIRIKYILNQSKLQFNLAVGLSPGILINNDIKITEYYDSGFITNSTSNRSNGIERVNLSGLFGFGFTYPINQKLSFHAQPDFRYYFLSIVSQPIKQYLYSAGVMVGVNYILQ